MAICNWNPAKCFLLHFYLFINIPVLYYRALGPSRGTKGDSRSLSDTHPCTTIALLSPASVSTKPSHARGTLHVKRNPVLNLS